MTAGTRRTVAGVCTVGGIIVLAWVTLQFESGAGPRTGLASERPAATPPAAPPSALWLLSVGVSRYQQADFNLQFADSDARAIADALQSQELGPLYAAAKALVLTNEEVTRESILASMQRFLGQAGPNDVVVIFLAGHGVQEHSSGSYYFLPFPATAETLVTAGLRMTDFDSMIRVLRRNVRGIVVMLDTCHAGSLRLASPGVLPGDELAARLSTGDGLFMLAATKPGEESKERPELAHGAFTYAVLEGLRGAADADGDGYVSVSDLFSYVAREVPRLTDGTQHPYNKVEGTDLVLAAVRPGGPAAARSGAEMIGEHAAKAAILTPLRPPTNTIGVMEFRDLRAEPERDWIGKALRVAFNTELSKVRALRVYSPALIDRAAPAGTSDDLSLAQHLGIRKLITGSFHVIGNTIRIDAAIVDSTTGVEEGSDSIEGDLADFFALQKRLVLSMLRRLRVELSPDEGTSIEKQTNTDVDAYRLLLESEGIVGQATPGGTPPSGPTPGGTEMRPAPQSRSKSRLSRLAALWAPEAYAAELPEDQTVAVRQLLAEYRTALEGKDLDRLAALYVSFSSRQGDALRVYLENATGLTVELTDITIEPRERDVAVSYTRRDRFVDRESGKPQQLEVRLTKILVRENATWKIAGGR